MGEEKGKSENENLALETEREEMVEEKGKVLFEGEDEIVELGEEKVKLEKPGLEAKIEEELGEEKGKGKSEEISSEGEIEEKKGKLGNLGLEAEVEEEKGKLKEGTCSKCHVKFQIICEATCSHWFCATCTIADWEQQSTDIEPCKCPHCHRPVTLLVPTEKNYNCDDDGNKYFHDPEVLIGIQTYNTIFGDQSKAPITQRLFDLPFLVRRLFMDFVHPDTSLPFLFRARVFITMILIVIYIFSPIDIIPEGIFGKVGLLDDLLITLIFFLHVAALYRSILCIRHGRNFRF